MKRYISIFMILMYCIGSQAQEKLFQEGLERGRAPKQFYCAKNSKGKGVTLEKMRQYGEKHNYLFGKYTTKLIDRFGDKQTTLDEIYFMPLDDYPRYVFEFEDCDYKENNQRGSCWLYIDGKFLKFENVSWSSSVEDGMLEGKGYAYWFDEMAHYFIAVKGQFQHGLPSGNMVVKRFSCNTSNPEDVVFEPQESIDVSLLSDGLASYSVGGGRWGFVSSNGTIAIVPTYESVIKEFSNGKAEVKLDGKEIIIDKSGKYVDLTANQKRLEEQQKQAELKRQQEELRRQEEENERQRLAAAQEAERRAAEIERKKNCEGRQIVWTETATYDFGEGGLSQGFLDLLGGSALHQVEYVVQYTAVVEKVIANESVKCIITRFSIQDPKFASVNYLKYRKYAVNDFSENVGKTRVLDMSEFELK